MVTGLGHLFYFVTSKNRYFWSWPTYNVRTTYESATLLYGFVIIFFEGFWRTQMRNSFKNPLKNSKKKKSCARSYRTEEAKKSCQTASKSSWKSIEEFEKKYLSSSLSWKTCQKSMEKSRRFRRFEVETCARVARPKKQKNCASLRRRILGNPLKNSKKKLLSDNFSWKSRQKFWSWNLRTCRTTEEAKKSRQTTSSNSSKSIEELEKKIIYFVKWKNRDFWQKQKNRVKLHRRMLRNPSKNSRKNFILWNQKEERLLIEAEKSRQTASKNSKFWVLLLLSRFERFEGALSAEK